MNTLCEIIFDVFGNIDPKLYKKARMFAIDGAKTCSIINALVFDDGYQMIFIDIDLNKGMSMRLDIYRDGKEVYRFEPLTDKQLMYEIEYNLNKRMIPPCPPFIFG